MRNIYKYARKTWTEDTKQNGLRKKDLRNKIIANVIAYFAIIQKKHNLCTSQMYKTAYLKLLIIDKVDTFLKKTAKKYCKMLKGVIY